MTLYSILKDFGLGSLFICGILLIIVNVITHAFVSRRENAAKDRDKVMESLKPLLRGTADLISRIVEILITHRSSTIEAIKSYSPSELENRIKNKVTTGDELNRHETTAYRLINFLALAKYFERQTSGLSPSPLLDRIEYFLQHKIAVGARGNLYGIPLLSSETQEDMASVYLKAYPDIRAVDLTLGSFLDLLRNEKYQFVLFKRSLEFVGIVPPYVSEWSSMDRTANNWKHTLSLAHFGIYLIDFYQELAQDPQWEEHRVFLTRLVKQWNVDSNTNAKFLYVHGDTQSNNYIDTFPSKRTSKQSAVFSAPMFKLCLFGVPFIGVALILSQMAFTSWWFPVSALLLFMIILVMESTSGCFFRFIKRLALNLRGARFGRRHYPKRIKSNGVVIKAAKKDYHVDYSSELRKVHSDVTQWLRQRLLDW